MRVSLRTQTHIHLSSHSGGPNGPNLLDIEAASRVGSRGGARGGGGSTGGGMRGGGSSMSGASAQPVPAAEIGEDM